MINICLDCGFEKDCSHDEFMSHMRLHDELDDILNELGIALPEPVCRITIEAPDEFREDDE